MGSLYALSWFIQTCTSVYGAIRYRPWKFKSKIVSTLQLRKKIQIRIQKKKIPHIVLVIVVDEAVTFLTLFNCVKSIVGSIYPERFIEVHLVFDYDYISLTLLDMLSLLKRSQDAISPIIPMQTELIFEKIRFIISRGPTVGICHAQVTYK